MVGCPKKGGGVYVYASATLSHARLTARVDEIRSRENGYEVRHPLHMGYELTASMGDIVCAQGETYAEALQHLMTFWSAPERVRTTREIAPARRSLPR